MACNSKLSVRLTDNQMLVLTELSQALDTSISVLMRSIVLDFITRNEERLDEIIAKRNGNANNQ